MREGCGGSEHGVCSFVLMGVDRGILRLYEYVLEGGGLHLPKIGSSLGKQRGKQDVVCNPQK